MKKIKFYKMQASGNDFILIDVLHRRLKGPIVNYGAFARKCCQGKFGIGADGLLVLEPSRKADFKMRIFNPDGSEPEMCGNGARCSVLYYFQKRALRKKNAVKFETKAGMMEARCLGSRLKKTLSAEVKIKMVDPASLGLDIPLTLNGRKMKVNFVNTGVPHVVVFVENLQGVDVESLGRALRFHRKFMPKGANVNFVEVASPTEITVRTYERGVEAETLACGTGVTASAIIAACKHAALGVFRSSLKVKTKSGEILTVSFTGEQGVVKSVWLADRAHLVYKGEISY